jgi:hypothetical protein
LAYTDLTAIGKKFKSKSDGGVGIYVKKTIRLLQVDLGTVDVEYLAVRMEIPNMTIVVVYRPPSYSITGFKKNLTTLLKRLHSTCDNSIVLGDFNDDGGLAFGGILSSFGYQQYVKESTTEGDTLLDHVYCRNISGLITTKIIPTYYSYHNAVKIDIISQVV